MLIYTPLRMPHHPTSFGARHVLAKAEPVPDRRRPARTMDVVGATSEPLPRPAAPTGGPVAVPTMDDLFV